MPPVLLFIDSVYSICNFCWCNFCWCNWSLL